MDPTPAELRHSIRGAFNALRLCVSALEMPLDTSEKLEFLSDIETAAERIATVLEQLDASLPSDHPEEPAGVAVALTGAHVR